jgi:hypothetical protein
MRCQKIGWEKVKRRALPHKNISRRVKGRTVWQTLYSSPKNVGASPLLSSVERGLLKSMARIGYHDVLSAMENEWKVMSSKEQHDHYQQTVIDLREAHKSYCDSASRVCGRQYKRRKYFEKVVGKSLPTGKKNKSDPKALSKHLADITKEVFGDSETVGRLPLQTSTWCLIVNTNFEDIVEQCVKDQSILANHFDRTKATQTLRGFEGVLNDKASLVASGNRRLYENFVSTNQYGVLDDSDEESTSDPNQVEGNS